MQLPCLMGVGLDLCGIGFPRWRSSLQFSLMPATKQLVMTIQGSSPVTATTMTTPNTPSLLRSLYFFFTWVGSQYYCLSPTHSGVYLCIKSSQLPLLQDSLCFFLHTSGLSNTLLCLFFFMGFRFQLPNHPWKISAIWSEVLVVFIDCTGPSDLYGISVIFTDPTEKLSSSLPLSFSLFVCVCLCFSLCALRIVRCTLRLRHPCITLEISASVFEAEYLTLFSRGWDGST